MKKGYKLYQVIIIMIITSIISGLTIGTILYQGQVPLKHAKYLKYLENEDIIEFFDIYDEISNKYYKDTNKNELIQNAINGMLSSLSEEYTTYLDKDKSISMHQTLNSTYKGIGIYIKDDIVVKVIEKSPADKAGVKEGDKLLKINNILVENGTTKELVEIINKSKKELNIDVDRNGEIISFNLKAEEITIPSVIYEEKDNGIGYLKIKVFSKNLNEEVKEVLKAIDESKIEKLIIDVRGNIGGYLTQAYNTSMLFLKKDSIIYYLESKDGIKAYKDIDDNEKNYKIAILINKETASAAEIFVSAMKDSYGVYLVGNNSYGKGKVQHTHKLTNGTSIKYTSYRWLRKDKACIEGVGIAPDVNIDNSYIYNKDNEIIGLKDTQLLTAEEYLKNS
ncbi:MAG: PDZ domain-containing protein [Mollicutes bacterium]|nr:PDZ domain-containing protein [Mollicutes bacterium]